MEALEREKRKLLQAHEILRNDKSSSAGGPRTKANVYVALAELDHGSKRWWV